MSLPWGRRLIYSMSKGKFGYERSLELRRRLHCMRAGDDLASGLVRNLGFVSLSHGRSSVIVKFRPEVVSEVGNGIAPALALG